MDVQDLFNKIPIYYDLDSKIFIVDKNSKYPCEVYSDTGHDLSFEILNNEDCSKTCTIKELYSVFCKNKNINRDEEIIIYDDFETIRIKDIEFKNNEVWLMIYGR